MPPMVEERIKNIEARIQASPELPDSTKAELLQVVAELRAELQGVAAEHLEQAHAASEPTAGDALGGLGGMVTALEATHPRIAAIANRLAVALSNMGI